MSWRHRSCQVFTCCGLRLEASTPNRVWSRSSQSNMAKITCTTVKFFHTPTSELVEMTCIQPLTPVNLQKIASYCYHQQQLLNCICETSLAKSLAGGRLVKIGADDKGKRQGKKPRPTSLEDHIM
ncbi:hypothetical protein ElyMa_006428800 [Elysia marginata]|uniref:Uncharacterized protein n=1 Tax=Elysia marginata TaxID=1093978 RepID=A0AAV4HVW0_9GAST|nr:hypothetical protein ElyMa_006428800 [Elysia marginata]